jgi:hypothetical protein
VAAVAKAGRQQAELRVVVEDDNRHALITSVTVQGLGHYIVETFKGGPVLRQSLHELGQSHTYVLGKRPIPASMGKAMRAFTGIRSVWGSSLSGGVDLSDWSYVPKRDRRNRRLTLVVPIGGLAAAEFCGSLAHAARSRRRTARGVAASL